MLPVKNQFGGYHMKKAIEFFGGVEKVRGRMLACVRTKLEERIRQCTALSFIQLSQAVGLTPNSLNSFSPDIS